MKDFFNNEWLLTNGLGGYASGTVSGATTRSHHGILVAAFNPPTDRKVMVAKVEERVFNKGSYSDLSTNQYPDVVHPNGTQYLKDYCTMPFPKWIYGKDDWVLEKSICMVQGSNTTLVCYRNVGQRPIVLELHPLYSCSDHHVVFRENSFTDFYTEIGTNAIKTFPYYGSIPIFTGWTKGEYKEARSWYKNIILPTDRERGLAFVCDYYRIGYLKSTLDPNDSLTIYFSIDERTFEKDVKDFSAKKTENRKGKRKKSTRIFYKDLWEAGDKFLVYRNTTKNKSIIAGYHWFEDWGRDTMISMRGLTIAKGNKLASQSILNTFFESINKGMIPDRFPDHSKDMVPYNTIDATLWLFIALYEYQIKFHDLDFVRRHLPVLKEILDYHAKGTRYNIHLTKEGFLYGGEVDEQLTWMDAKVGGVPITPRIGCPVEVNALWYNALRIYDYLSHELKIKIDKIYTGLIDRFEKNFTKFFLNPQGTLYDVIMPGAFPDNSFRPNQLYVLSLPFTILGPDEQKLIFEAIKSKLYTPFGLRTLDVENPKFQGTYEGNQWQRDHAYHQGTVWPFLLYEYYNTYFKLYGATPKNKKKVVKELALLREHFYHHEGLHCISEVFDGLKPFEGKGCIHQAWSVGALIKLYTDYELHKIDI